MGDDANDVDPDGVVRTTDDPVDENEETSTSPNGDDTTNPGTDDTTTPTDPTDIDSPDGEEEPSEPVEPKPEDLTGDAEEMRYVGWKIPKECNKLEVGSIVALFCPDLRYLMNTQQVIDESFASSENYMETNPEQFAKLSNPPVYSLSKESEHTSDLILVMEEKVGSVSDIYRLSAAEENSEEKFVMTKLFRMRI